MGGGDLVQRPYQNQPCGQSRGMKVFRNRPLGGDRPLLVCCIHGAIAQSKGRSCKTLSVRRPLSGVGIPGLNLYVKVRLDRRLGVSEAIRVVYERDSRLHVWTQTVVTPW
jgi:hypothetical protein